MTYNASEEKQVEQARKQAEKDEALKLSVIKNLMDTSPGRSFVYDQLNSGHIFSTSFVQGSPDASAFREGERNHALRLLADVMNACPESYLTMCEENK